MKLNLYIQKLKAANITIRLATGYTKEYLKCGSSCDSSDDRIFRIRHVLEAQEQYIKIHQKEILQLAALNIEKELQEAVEQLTEQAGASEPPAKPSAT